MVTTSSKASGLIWDAYASLADTLVALTDDTPEIAADVLRQALDKGALALSALTGEPESVSATFVDHRPREEDDRFCAGCSYRWPCADVVRSGEAGAVA